MKIFTFKPIAFTVLVLFLFDFTPSFADDMQMHHHNSEIPAANALMESQMPMHEHKHSAIDINGDVKRSVIDVHLHSIKMVRQDGVLTNIAKELTSGKPTILAFIYTTCTTVCPVTTQILSVVQNQLIKDSDNFRIVSVSIDPEYDTPARLVTYGKKFGALVQWQHYTGTIAQSESIQKAFGAFQADKMNHIPLIFVGGGDKKSWVRLEGFPSPEQVVNEYRNFAKN
jgi:protein SCO1/2